VTSWSCDELTGSLKVYHDMYFREAGLLGEFTLLHLSYSWIYRFREWKRKREKGSEKRRG